VNKLEGRVKVDFRSDEPLFLQIERQIQELLITGELKVGDQLPTLRELATELRVNFNTVARAYRLLDEARLISTQRGRGTYIWEEPTPEVVKQLRQRSLQELAQQYLDAANRLGFSSQEAVKTLENLAKASPPAEPPAEQNQH
jgi:GntR family transcriptional regulator